MKNNTVYILLLIVVALVAGCKSQKQSVDAPVALVGAEQIKSLPSFLKELSGVSFKARLTANVGGKDLSSSGTMKIKRGDGIQISITPLGIFEAARVEFFPLYAQYINRLESEYARVNYSSLPQLGTMGLGYPLLESVLLNEVYIPADVDADKFLSTVSVALSDNLLKIEYEKGDLKYEFYIDEATKNLVKSVGIHKSGATVTCVYDNFQNVLGREFPMSVKLSFATASKNLAISFSLSNAKELTELKATTPSSSYKKLQTADFIKIFRSK